MSDEEEEALREEIAELHAAIAKHRDQKADDRCWMDDQELYKVLGDGNLGDCRVGDQSEMLRNCQRFIEKRTEGGGWVSYAMMEEELRKLKGRAYVQHGGTAENPCGAILETAVDHIDNVICLVCPSCDRVVTDEEVEGAQEETFYLVRKP